MTRLRLVTNEEIKKSEMAPIVKLKNMGDIYAVMSPCDRGLDLVFIRFVTIKTPTEGIPGILASMAPPSGPITVPKAVHGVRIHLDWKDKLLRRSLPEKAAKEIARWVIKLNEFDSILTSSNAAYIASLEDNHV